MVSMHAAEDMLAAIAQATGCLVGIAVGRLETVKLAGLPEHLFTTDNSATRIRYRTWPQSIGLAPLSGEVWGGGAPGASRG